MTVEQIARIAHEVNRAYCATISDNTVPNWENAPDWQKDSIINSVRYHGQHAAKDCDIHLSHVHLLAQKLSEGWTCGTGKGCCVKTTSLLHTI